jgi:hypothetical protein
LTVPDVVSQAETDAKGALEKAGLVAKVAVQRTDAVPAGRVVSTEPKAGQPVKPQSAVTLTVAQPVSVDLVAAAAGATWTADGKALPFPTGTGAGPPAARTAQTAALADGTTGTVLLTQPVLPTGRVTGEFPIADGTVAGDHLVAKVGFLQGTDGTVDFVVSVDGRPLKTVTVAATDTKLEDIDVPLPAGATGVQISAAASAGSAGQRYEAVWKDLRVSAGGK